MPSLVSAIVVLPCAGGAAQGPPSCAPAPRGPESSAAASTAAVASVMRIGGANTLR
jgi:hypothetical protein